MPDDPTDAELKARLAAADPAGVESLEAAITSLRATPIDELFRWSEPRGDGSPEDPVQMPYPTYSATVDRLIGALHAVDAVPIHAWMDWPGARTYRNATALADAPVADSMRMVTVIVRSERFSDGAIARALTDGTLLAAAERIAQSLRKRA